MKTIAVAVMMALALPAIGQGETVLVDEPGIRIWIPGTDDTEPPRAPGTFSEMGQDPPISSDYDPEIPDPDFEPLRVQVIYVEAPAPSYSPDYDPYWDSGWDPGWDRPPLRIPPVTSHTSRSSGITYLPENSPHQDSSTAVFNRSWNLGSPHR